MDYSCDTRRAQEIARLILPTMTRLGIPVTPINYALWYEYHLGRSDELVEALDRIDSGKEPYDGEKAKELFLRYVAMPGVETLEHVEVEVCRLVGDIVQIIIDAGLDLNKYTAVLNSCNRRLENADDLREIRKLVRTVLDDTRAMSQSNRAVAQTLKERADEIDRLRSELDQVRREAVRDPLTGLANRRAFDERLAESLDDALLKLKTICLMMIDVDHFKEINDRHGHQIGDRILQFIASVLKKNFKGRDVVARFGGDEFAVIVEDAPLAGVTRIGEAIRQQVEESYLKRTDTGEPLGTVTVSVGFDCVVPGDTQDSVLDRADKALYQAKQQGRNKVMSYRR